MNRLNVSMCMAALSLAASAAGAATFPYAQDFSGATLGQTKSPYNGISGSGVNESTLPENPTGWIDGPPVTAGSNTSPWSIADGAGANGRYLRFSGPSNFDGNGRGYASVPVTGIATTAGSGFKQTSTFQFDALTLDGATDSFRFGLGALGAQPNFASNAAGSTGAGGTSFYLADAGFTSAGTTDLASQQLNLRIFRFGGAGNVELVSVGVGVIPVGYLNTTDVFQMTLAGTYDALGGLTLQATLDNITSAADDVFQTASVLEAAPLTGTYFGYRHNSGTPASANRLATLDFRHDNFAVTPVPEPATLAAVIAGGALLMRRRRI